MNVFRIVALISALCVNGNLAFTSGDDKFIKKYAMMKVYENCFGPDVVKEVRKEMKIATAKCNGNMPMSVPTPNMGSLKLAMGQPNIHEFTGAHHQQQQQQHQQQAKPQEETSSFSKTQPSIDITKLQQAILAGYNKHLQQQSSSQQQYSSQQSAQPQPQQYVKPWSSSGGLSAASPSVSAAPSSFMDQQPYMTNALFYPPGPAAASTADMYLPRISGVVPQPQPYPGAYPMMGQMYQPQPYYQPYFGTHRTSRVGGFDVRNQMDTMTAKMTGKIRNVTCVMQELGYLNQNMEPDYENMNDRVMRLPIAEELKQDMVDGITYCKKFSMCVPDERKDKFAKELVRPMFFFKCYKHKKLESCIMKDIRDRYTAEEFGEDNMVTSERSMRSSHFLEDDTIEQTVFDYIYGDKSIDLDVLL
ncbi:Pheromone/general odorant binding protein [Cinara cedri]|uniref:Pheromone/general odorant binding protein n=1 Tax=Cinara cedri TaxID=506608 RepID=A0A5E4NPQ9_9HEMI|nr:Pheromone/general odorant binding protein [Cinara cedri]